VTSGSAYWIAAARARESTRPDRLFDDPWAERLAGDLGRAAMAASERATGGENQFLPVRTRFVDDALLAALADPGTTQVVMLGAGLDTRPYRLPVPAGVDWYELDRPEPLAHKASVLAAAGARPGCRRHDVAADLTGDWLAPLRAAGLAADRRTAWVAEGLLFYLAGPDVAKLLATAASAAAPGSTLIADIFGATGLARPELDAYRRHAKAAGTPPPFGHDDPAALLSEAGWEPTLITWAGAPDANYGRLRPVPGSSNERPHYPTQANLIVAASR